MLYIGPHETWRKHIQESFGIFEPTNTFALLVFHLPSLSRQRRKRRVLLGVFLTFLEMCSTDFDKQFFPG